MNKINYKRYVKHTNFFESGKKIIFNDEEVAKLFVDEALKCDRCDIKKAERIGKIVVLYGGCKYLRAEKINELLEKDIDISKYIKVFDKRVDVKKSRLYIQLIEILNGGMR
jgi:hypothetical protein